MTKLGVAIDHRAKVTTNTKTKQDKETIDYRILVRTFISQFGHYTTFDVRAG